MGSEYNIFKSLGKFLGENRQLVFAYIFFSLGTPIIEVVLPHYYGKLIEGIRGSTPNARPPLKSNGGFPKNSGTIAPLVKTILALWIISQVFNGILDYLDSIFIPKLQSYIRMEMVNTILQIFKENHKDLEIGDLLAKIIKLPVVIRDLFHQIRSFMLPSLLVLIAAAGYFTYIDIRLGMLSILGFVLFIGIAVKLGNSCMDVSQNLDDEHNSLHEDISDLFYNLLNVYSSNTIADELKKLEEYQENMDNRYAETIKCSSKFKLAFNASFIVIFTCINGFAYYLYKKGEIPVDKLVSVFIIVLYIIAQLSAVSSEIRDFVFNMGTILSTQKYLQSLSPPESNVESFNGKIEDGTIDFINVNMKIPHMDNFNLHVDSKEKVVIVGKIGSGKTTILRLLLKLKLPNSGQILIDGQNMNCDSIREQVTYVPQNPQLFNRTILENIGYGIPNLERDDVEKTLKSLELNNMFGTHTLDSNVGKNGTNLSGGQKQMIFLLRCFFRPTKIIILDEPTSSLDDVSKEYILKLLPYLFKNKTVLAVTHDSAIIPYFDRVVKMEI